MGFNSGFKGLKCFTHHLTLLAPMHTSPYTHWSLWWISAAGISSLTRNSMTARWRNKTSLLAILYHLFMVTWCKLLTPYLTQRYDNSWCHLPNNTQLFDVAELPTMWRCSWLSVWPSYYIVRSSNLTKEKYLNPLCEGGVGVEKVHCSEG